jgi:hypothetical protein
MKKARKNKNILNSMICIRVGENVPFKLLQVKREKHIAKDINQSIKWPKRSQIHQKI